MVSRVTIKDDRRGLDQIKAELKKASGRYIVAGITHAAGGEVLSYANHNEFGANGKPHSFVGHPKGGPMVPHWYHVSGKIPSRPFMRSYYDENLKKIGDFAANQFLKVVRADGMGDMDKMYNSIGLYIQNGIKNRIRTADRWAVPNAPLTILLKGSSKPLIDHGILINSVTFDIRTGR